MDYKKTLNLPKTSFPMKANLPQREPQFLKLWHDMDISEKIEEAGRHKEKFILHDGPPYANGRIHMGHVLNKILKDFVVKFKNLTGYNSPYLPGWDCHGLPVEHQLFKTLKLRKDQIDQVEFRKKARDYAMKYVKIQRDEFKRLGIFGKWDEPYLTLTHEYESEILRAFAKLVKDGYIYKDLKPVNWCTTCETALAEAEVEYEQHSSPSIYVKFRVKKSNRRLPDHMEKGDAYLLIWTTTPWTLMANVACAVHPDLEYAMYTVGKEKWVMQRSLSEQLAKKCKLEFTENAVFKGSDLEGIILKHPFIDRDSICVTADYVSSEDGTGCVHTAPGHGQEDYITGKKYNLDLIMPVDNRGNFDDTCGEFSNMNVHEANDKIIERMRSLDMLIYTEKIRHSYPHCWRCKKAIIFRATWQWFLNVDHNSLRKALLKAITDKVKWHPEASVTRIYSMVENRPDWCLSRQRYWGVPIPAFYCGKCEKRILEYELIMRVAELAQKDGIDIWFKEDARRLLPEKFRCPGCGSNEIKKENDILDVWFESGVSHQSVLKKTDYLSYPCDLYLEGSDQHRGWFQSSIITAQAIDGTPPYREVLTHGFTVDGEGKKMSKSMGNVVSPQDLMKKYGADILRLWVASSNYSDDIKISDEIMQRTADAYRKIRNTFRYLTSNLNDFDPSKDSVEHSRLCEIDRWMLSRLGNIIKETQLAYQQYVFHRVYRLIYNFCVYEVSSLYLDIAKDRLYTFRADSRKRRSAQTAIFRILTGLVRVISPILSFTTEEVWRDMRIIRTCESVHLSRWPDAAEELDPFIDMALEGKWVKYISVRECVQKSLEMKRSGQVIGSSLDASVEIFVRDADLLGKLKKDVSLLPEFFIVSDVKILDKKGADSIDFNEPGIFVNVSKALGEKCVRCWNYSDSVGKDALHPDICAKCVKNIS